MKYLIDAHLPRRLSNLLLSIGFDSVHTLDLAYKNATKDSDINILSLEEKRVVVSKDSDFIDSLLISNKPYKLVYVATGNISNKALLQLFIDHINQIDSLLDSNRFVELNAKTIITHG